MTSPAITSGLQSTVLSFPFMASVERTPSLASLESSVAKQSPKQRQNEFEKQFLEDCKAEINLWAGSLPNGEADTKDSYGVFRVAAFNAFIKKRVDDAVTDGNNRILWPKEYGITDRAAEHTKQQEIMERLKAVWEYLRRFGEELPAEIERMDLRQVVLSVEEEQDGKGKEEGNPALKPSVARKKMRL